MEPSVDTLTPMQRAAYIAVVNEHKNVIVAGPAGSGKSLFVECVKRAMPQTHVTATTGVAAVNVQGVTYHKFAGVGIMGIKTNTEGRIYKRYQQVLCALENTNGVIELGMMGREQVTYETLDKLEAELVERVAGRLSQNAMNYTNVLERVRKAEAMVIDEISMMSRFNFEVLELYFRLVRNVDAPWGGIQLVVVGDMFQLPPVAPGTASLNDIMADMFFQSRKAKTVFQDRVYVLDKVFRQTDEHFRQLLNRVARGNVTAEDVAALKSRVIKPVPDNATHMLGRNRDVALVNDFHMGKITHPPHVFTMTSKITRGMGGKAHQMDSLREWAAKSCIADEEIVLKAGAYVMLLWNVDVEAGLANGTCGYIVGFTKEGFPQFVRCRDYDPAMMKDYTEDGSSPTDITCSQMAAAKQAEKTAGVVVIPPATWTVTQPGVAEVAATQIPIKPAYAVSIHKSQGQQYDRTIATIDPRNCFCKGQAYVALSRQKGDISGLYLGGFDEDAIESVIQADERAVAFYERYEAKGKVPAAAAVPTLVPPQSPQPSQPGV